MRKYFTFSTSFAKFVGEDFLSGRGPDAITALTANPVQDWGSGVFDTSVSLSSGFNYDFFWHMSEFLDSRVSESLTAGVDRDFAESSFNTPYAVETTPLISSLGIPSFDFAASTGDDTAPTDAISFGLPGGLKTGKNPLLATIDTGLYQLANAYASAMTNGNNASQATAMAVAQVGAMMPINDGYVTIDVMSKDGDAAALLETLTALGLTHGGTFGGMVSGLLPISSIQALAGLASVGQARVSHATTMAGSVDNQADAAMQTDDARTTFSVDGTGVSVGILSDSFDNLGGYATDIGTSDLPAGITVLDDLASGGSDEGRAMAQLVHDVAPGADLLFHTAFTGIANFAQGILDLAAAGADIIVDDVIYFAEPMFQDGVIAQAVDQVFAMGVPYFSSAGNSARQSYESDYRGVADAGLNALAGSYASWHDFDPGAGTDTLQAFTLNDGESVRIALQWDEPFFDSGTGSPGSSNDVDIYILDAAGSSVLAGSFDNNFGGSPFEFLTFQNTTGSTATFNVAIGHWSGTAPNVIKYVDFNGGTNGAEFFTNSGSSYGHSSAEGGQGVGASAFFFTPEFGVDPPLLNSFSSAGGTPIYFDTAGNRLITPEMRERVDFTAPDGGNTTFFGSDSGADADAFPNFFGTSAAAPNAAALAALLLEHSPGVSPTDIYNALQSSAIDIVQRSTGAAIAVGADEDSGVGLIEALAAFSAIPPTPTTISVSIADAEVSENGGTSVVTISIDAAALGDTTINLTSSDTTEGTVPASVVIPDGQTSVTTTFTAVDDAIVDGTQTVTITGSASGFSSGNDTIDVTDDDGFSAFRDFDEDGSIDLLFKDDATGAFQRLLDPTSAGAPASQSWANASFVGLADVDGDGVTDNIVQAPNGNYAVHSAGSKSGASQITNTGYDIIGFADLDGDGNDEALARSTAMGDTSLIVLDNALTSATTVGMEDSVLNGFGDFDNDGVIDAFLTTDTGHLALYNTDSGFNQIGHRNKTVVAIGDFDGDGNDDAILHPAGSNNHVLLASVSGTPLSQLTVIGEKSYTVLGTGDFDGDGSLDVLADSPTRGFRIWTEGLQTIIEARHSQFDFAGIGDFDGDGEDDILLTDSRQDGKGRILYSGDFTDFQSLGSMRGTTVRDIADYNGDGSDDILIQDNTTGEYSILPGGTGAAIDLDASLDNAELLGALGLDTTGLIDDSLPPGAGTSKITLTEGMDLTSIDLSESLDLDLASEDVPQIGKELIWKHAGGAYQTDAMGISAFDAAINDEPALHLSLIQNDFELM